MDNNNKAKAGREATNNIGLVKDLMYSGGVYRGQGGRFISKEEAEKNKINPEFYQTISKSPLSLESLDKVAKSMKLIAQTLTNINKTIADKQSRSAYESEEAALEARPQDAKKIEEGKSLKSDLADVFKNPAFLAALTGIIYAVLPEDVQKKVGALLGGFATGVEKGTESFGELSNTVKLAGAGIALFIGGKFLKNIAELTTGMLRIGKRLGKMGKVGKAAVALTAGAVAVDYATDKMKEGGSETESGGAAPESKNESDTVAAPAAKTERGADAAPARAGKPTAAATASKGTGTAAPVEAPPPAAGSSGTGITPGAKLGFKPTGGGGFKATKDMIKMHEGVRNRPYKDSLGLWTVGVGHLIGDGKSLPPEYDRTFSDEEINALFDSDFEHHRKQAEKIPGFNKMNEQGKGAMIDLTFNMGPEWPKKFKNAAAAIEKGDYETAGNELQNSLWYKQVGRRGATIVSMIKGAGSGGGPEATSVPSPASSGDSISESLARMSKPYEYKPSAEGAGLQTQIAELQKSQGISDAELMSQVEKNDGKAVAAMTGEVRTKTALAKITPPTVNSFDLSSSKEVGGGTQYEAPPPIPSPIANRGTLAAGVTHYSAV